MRVRCQVGGTGAVSPAGWGVDSLWRAITQGASIPARVPSEVKGRQIRGECAVPPPPASMEDLRHPRLRRSSAISGHAVAAAVEALGPWRAAVRDRSFRLGMIICVMTGSVTYSRRFYDEVLRVPGKASPLLFPETVFNAPASHVAAVLETEGVNHTLVGDPSTWVQALRLGVHWMEAGDVDAVLVIGAEEVDWLTSAAWGLFARETPVSGGAGAVFLVREPSASWPVLEAIIDPITYRDLPGRKAAVERIAAALRASNGDLLVDSRNGSRRYDAAEDEAWHDWTGPRWSPKCVLGEGLAAGSAWQAVVSIEAIRNDLATRAWMSVAGVNMAAAGAVWARG